LRLKPKETWQNGNARPGGTAAGGGLRPMGRILGFVALLGMAVNLLMLTGPIYMLQVYDRVLGSRSEETLVALTLLAGFLFAMMGVFDVLRGRIMTRLGARLDREMSGPVFAGLMRLDRGRGHGAGQAAEALRGLDTVPRFLAAPVCLALFDLPWVPLFLGALWLFHPWLGWLALIGALALTGLSILGHVRTRRRGARAALDQQRAQRLAETAGAAAVTARALGMVEGLGTRWQGLRGQARRHQIAAADIGGGAAAMARVARLGLQSALLGLGAYLVLRAELSPGAMIAASVLMGRALAPVEQVVGQWPMIGEARKGWEALRQVGPPAGADPSPLPRPEPHLQVQQATIRPDAASPPVLRGLSFEVRPGEILGLCGPSGAGKTTLIEALAGVWPPVWGKIRLGGVPLAQYGAGVLGRWCGYLPQRAVFFDGTIAENIARLQRSPDMAAVIAAARLAGAHETILDCAAGYDTVMTAGGAPLSGGQAQQVALARALFGAPGLILLDEPEAHLDAAGRQRLGEMLRDLRAAGRAVVLASHDAEVLGHCDLVLTLEAGLAQSFLPGGSASGASDVARGAGMPVRAEAAP